jgi:hypothetical protein
MPWELFSLHGQCPVQAEAKAGDTPVYFRARGTYWTFSAGADPLAVCQGREQGFFIKGYYDPDQTGFSAAHMPHHIALLIIERCCQRYLRARHRNTPARPN